MVGPDPIREAILRSPSLRAVSVLVLLSLASGLGQPLEGQQRRPLKRSIPGENPFACPTTPMGAEATESQRAQAAQFGTDAARQRVLGNQDSARDMLERAVQLDPRSGSLAYQYGRILEAVGDRRGARLQYCRVHRLAEGSTDDEDAQRRLAAFDEDDRRAIPSEAVAAFRTGLTDADAGRLEAAVDAFEQAGDEAPTLAEAFYNRGAILAQLERADEAIADLRVYQQLAPDAEDGNDVAEWIGQLQSLGSLPSPGAALTLGFFVPGMGQFYSGRPLGGFTYLTLAGGALAAGLLIEDVEVKCLDPVPPGGTCAPGRVFDSTVDKPYRTLGFAAAATITVIGAIEAFVKARGRRAEAEASSVAVGLGNARLLLPDAARRGDSVDLRLLRVRF